MPIGQGDLPQVPHDASGNLILPSLEVENSPISGINACAGVYLSVFERPPFSDIPSINGQQVPGLFYHPGLTAQLISNLDAQGTFTTASILPSGEEIVHVSPRVILKFVTELITDPSVGFYLEQGWISVEDLTRLKRICDTTSPEQEDLSLTFAYPLSKIRQLYHNTASDPRSAILLGHSKSPHRQEDLAWSQVETDTHISASSIPRGLSRTRAINYPPSKGEERASIHRILDEEFGYYLSPSELDQLKALIPDLSSCWVFGEVAKVPSDDKTIHPLREMMKHLVKVVGGIPKIILTRGSTLPDHFVFMTMRGTSMASDSGPSGPMRMVTSQLKRTGVRVTEDVLTFDRADHPAVIVGVVHVQR